MKVSEKFLLQIIEEEAKSALSQSTLIKEGVPKALRTKLYNKFAEFFNWGDARKPVKSTEELTDAATTKLTQQQQEVAERATQAAAKQADEAAKRKLLYQDELVQNAIDKANKSLKKGVIKVVDNDITLLPVVFRPTSTGRKQVTRQGRVTVDPTEEGIANFRAWAAKEGHDITSGDQAAIEGILEALYNARIKRNVAAKGELLFSAVGAGRDYSPALKKVLAGVGLAAGGVVLWQIAGDKLTMWAVPKEVVEEIDRAQEALDVLDDMTVEDVEAPIETGEEDLEEKPEDKAKGKPASPGTWSGF